MYRSSKLHVSVLWSALGVICITLGITCVIYEPFKIITKNLINKEARLIDGTVRYKVWNLPLKFLYMVYIFNVTNPDEVLKGELPHLVECGPYIYDEIMQKEILEIDELADEIKFVIKRKFNVNKTMKTNVSLDNILTILNVAYIGIINTLATLPESFMNQFGNVIPKLFPNPKTIFLKGKVRNILFDGLKLMCNPKRHPELTIVCLYLQNNKLPNMKESGKEGVYLFSLFSHMNDSVEGPFIMNRGLKNISRLGDITTFRGDRIQEIWRTEECNIVSGKEFSTLPPRQQHSPRLNLFTAEICREIYTEYSNEAIINGLKTKRYTLTEEFYEQDNECHCPKVLKKVQCLPEGLLDGTACMGVPIIYSEPHFLHGDSNLLNYVRGLKPDEKLHSTDMNIHEMTGMSVTGHKRVQLNLKVSPQPVDLLANVSEGFFPLVWFEESYPIQLNFLVYGYQTQRTMFLIPILHLIPIIFGIYIVLATIFLHGERVIKTTTVNSMIQNVPIPRNSHVIHVHNLTHRSVRY